MSKNSRNAVYTNLSLPAKYLGNPLNFIEEFFEHANLHETQRILHNQFIAIYNVKRRKEMMKYSGSNELFSQQMFIKFLEAMWLIWMEDKEQLKGAIPAAFQKPAYLFDQPFFTREKERHPWLCVPCYLTEEEFYTPMLTVEKFFKRKALHKWKGLLDEIIHNILSTAMPDFGNSYTNPYEIHFYLASLIEAAFLIHIRQQEYFLTHVRNLQNASKETETTSQPTTIINGTTDGHPTYESET